MDSRTALLATRAVTREMARHNPVRLSTGSGPQYFCSTCWNDCGQLMWPCPTVENLQEADEAITMALERGMLGG